MKAISALVMASALLATPAFADNQAHFRVLDATFQGACGDVKPISNLQQGDASIDILFPDLSAQTNDVTPVTRKLCNVRVHVKIDKGYQVSLGKVFYQGKFDIDQSGGSSNVSARAFFHALPGIDGFRRFTAGESGNFQVDAAGSTPGTVCGGETYLNLLVDITARDKPGNGQFSEIAIQRAVGTPGEPGYKSRISCGVQQRQCGR